MLTFEETAAFLRHCQHVDDPLTELYELLIYTGMRKGQALGLHRTDVDLDARLLFVRHPSSPSITTASSSTPPGQTPARRRRHRSRLPRRRIRVLPARRADRCGPSVCSATSTTSSTRPVCRTSESTTWRHLAATIMMSTTVDINGHLTRQAAQDAVDATSNALDDAEREAV